MFVLLLALLLPGCGVENPPPVEGVDRDGDRFFPPDDCDDNNALVNPNAEEECDGLDNDCDGNIDDKGAGSGAWYPDVDGDGFGDKKNGVVACDQPTGMIGDGNDCNDNDATAFPENPEVCDEIDNDCDGRVDEGATDIVQSWIDTDGDGYGDSDHDNLGCSVPEGYSLLRDDCDVTDPLINPGVDEIWYDGVDQNCDGANDYDQDGDGEEVLGTGEDCDDEERRAYPGGTEVCGNGIDEDCSGADLACG